MINFKSVYKNLKEQSSRVGYRRAVSHLVYQKANAVFSVRRFDVVYLNHDFLTPLDPAKYTGISSRLATEEDLLKMRAEKKWLITDELMENFRQGDSCLMSFVNDNLAGYTWIHTAGCPRLVPGLTVSIPENYGYNFAGFTLPEFRGFGLQSYRHHAILNRPELGGKTGMIGYVDATNWSSKKGQAKSGFQKLGTLTLVGTKNRFKVIVSEELKKFGIRRLDA